MKQGYDEDHAIENAVNYGMAQIRAGVDVHSLETTIKTFKEMAEIATAFANVLEQNNAKVRKKES